MGNNGTSCCVYEKELVDDFVHDTSSFYTEVFIPTKKLIVRLSDKKIIYCYKSDEAQTEEKVINSLTGKIGKIRNIRMLNLDNKFVNTCAEYFRIKQELDGCIEHLSI